MLYEVITMAYAVSADSETGSAAQICDFNAEVPNLKKNCVITSYSIHYTKLYDSRSSPRPSTTGLPRPSEIQRAVGSSSGSPARNSRRRNNFV